MFHFQSTKVVEFYKITANLSDYCQGAGVKDHFMCLIFKAHFNGPAQCSSFDDLRSGSNYCK
jgi:hypothetical protein